MTTRFIYVASNISSKLVSVVARLSCSSNMLEGDTGYDVIKHSKIQWSDIFTILLSYIILILCIFYNFRCALWPSSLFLSEFILSYPKIFSSKCCFEVSD